MRFLILFASMTSIIALNSGTIVNIRYNYIFKSSYSWIYIKSFSFTSVFVSNHLTEKRLDALESERFEVLESEVRGCSDAGKSSLGDEAECQEAAKELGLDYRRDVTCSRCPKGCFTDYNGVYGPVYWNNHETGAIRSEHFPICRKGGNYFH